MFFFRRFKIEKKWVSAFFSSAFLCWISSCFIFMVCLSLRSAGLINYDSAWANSRKMEEEKKRNYERSGCVRNWLFFTMHVGAKLKINKILGALCLHWRVILRCLDCARVPVGFAMLEAPRYSATMPHRHGPIMTHRGRTRPQRLAASM